MQRVAHREKASTGGSNMIRRWVFFDTETRKVPVGDGTFSNKLVMGWALYFDRDRGVQEWCFFTNPDTFWDFVESKVVRRMPLCLMAFNSPFDLRVTKWYSQLFKKRGWVRGRNIILPDLSPLPFVVDLRKNDYRITIRDLANYLGFTPLEVIGKQFNLPKLNDVVDFKKEPDRWMNVKPGTQDWETLKFYCKRDTEIVFKAMCVLMAFLEENNLGSLAISAASQSKLAFRRMMPTNERGQGVIFYHTDERKLRLERESYIGARVEIFNHRGIVQGPIREFDFNSLYPSVQRNNLYPVEAITKWGYSNNAEQATRTLRNIHEMVEQNICVVARVTVNIPRNRTPHLPYRHTGRLLFPTGQFTTVLTTPELLYAYDNNYVETVHEYSLYRGRTDLFTRYVDFFYNKREEYKQQGNTSFEQMCKLFMNSLYGKFGQHSYEWQILGYVGFPDARTVNVEGVRYRTFGDVTERRSESKVEPPASFAAIAAHVTAYGRQRLREAIDAVGVRNVAYVDTDSVHVVGDDYVKLAHMIDQHKLGYLKMEDHKGNGEPGSWGIYMAPKDYHLDGKPQKIKGVRKGSEEIRPGVWKTLQIQGFAGAFRQGDLDTVIMRDMEKRRQQAYNKAFVLPGADTIIPWHFVNNIPINDVRFYSDVVYDQMY